MSMPSGWQRFTQERTAGQLTDANRINYDVDVARGQLWTALKNEITELQAELTSLRGATEPAPVEPAEVERILFSARISAWFTTRMEVDKTLLTLSALGLGVWRFWIDAAGQGPEWARWSHSVMALCFLCTVAVVLGILWFNSKVIEDAIQGDPVALNASEAKIFRMDKAAYAFFAAGLALLLAVGVEMTWRPEKPVAGEQMEDSKKEDVLKKSAAGSEKLRPARPPAPSEDDDDASSNESGESEVPSSDTDGPKKKGAGS